MHVGKRKRRRNAAKRNSARRSAARSKSASATSKAEQATRAAETSPDGAAPGDDEAPTDRGADETSTDAHRRDADAAHSPSDASDTSSGTASAKTDPPTSGRSTALRPASAIDGAARTIPFAAPRYGGWPRLAVGASVGAALLSTAVALYVVLRPPAPAVESAASIAVAEPGPRTPTSVDAEAVTPTTPEPEPEPEPEPLPADEPEVPWPDLSVDGLPPVDAAPEPMGQSLGSPRDGALLRPSQLPASRDYLIRNQDTAWGTDNTIAHLRAAIATVRRANPQLHRLVIGDISTRRGGPLDGHTSHQAGRDVDIGLFYRGHADDGPTTFVEATREILDRRATLDLVMALASTRDDPTGVELIVLDYNLQRILRRTAEQRGIAEERLEALFQFPHGPNSRHGLVRHKPAHRDHLHVRFRCPLDDDYCRDPLIGFGGMEAPDPAGT